MDDGQFDRLTRRLLNRTGNRRRALRLAGALALPGAQARGSAAAGAATIVADAFCPTPATLTGFGRARFAQTFTAQHTGTLTRVQVFAHSPDPANTDDYRFEIRKTTRNGKPGKTVLASTVVNNVVRPAPGQTTQVTAEFNPGARIEKGKRYALVLSCVNCSEPNVRSNTDPGCAGALFEDDGLTNTFTKDPGTDIVFSAFVTRP
ncbi:MAG TPA: hypothetical protein VFU81_19555 [Thermomicrobiales bacterium]|nr:hypothetical protein [Thermomicrobiales bacterium]